MKYVLAIVLFITVHAQFSHVYIKNYKIDLGLADNTIYSILERDDGTLLVGTENGLNIFDGLNFSSIGIESKTVINSNNILRFNSKIFVFTYGNGIFELMQNKLNYLKINDELPSLYIQSVASIEDRYLVVGTREEGLVLFDKDLNKLGAYQVKNSNLSSNKIWDILAYKNGFYLATEFGLDYFNLDNFTIEKNVIANTALSHIKIRKIIMDNDENLWLGTQSGITKYSLFNNSYQQIFYKDKTYTNAISNIVTDFYFFKNLLLIGTISGLKYIDLNDPKMQIKDFVEDHELNSIDIRRIYVDKYNLIWIGSRNYGLYKVNIFNNFLNHRKLNRKDSPPNLNKIYSFLKDEDSNFWIGSDFGLYRKFANGRELYYPFGFGNELINDNSIRCLIRIKNELFIGTKNGGVNRLNITNNKLMAYYNSSKSTQILDNQINDLFHHDNELFIANTKGVNVLNLQSNMISAVQENNQILNDFMIDLDIIDNKLVIASIKEIYLYDFKTKEIIKQQLPFNLSGSSKSNLNFVKVFQNQVIVGSKINGIYILNKNFEIIKNYNELTGLKSNNVYAAEFFNDSILFVSHNKGLTKISLKNNRINNFTVHDGLQELQFISKSSYKSQSDSLYFGGINGYNVIHNDEIIENKMPVKILLNSITIMSNEIKIVSQINIHEKINLEHNQNSIEFSFISLDMRYPEKNLYTFKLDGYDLNWSPVTNQNKVLYQLLKPGTYVFHVKASNNDGYWNNEGLHVSFEIQKPFWLEEYFWLTVIIFLVLIVSIMFKLKYQSIIKNEKKLEETINSKTNALSKKTAQLEKLNKFQNNLNTQFTYNAVFDSFFSLKIVDEIEKASFMILDKSQNIFRMAYSYGWEIDSLSTIQFTSQDLEIIFKKNAKKINEFIYYNNHIDSMALQKIIQTNVLTKNVIYFELDNNGTTEAIIILDNITKNLSFESLDLDVLINIREIFKTSFIKMKMLEDLNNMISQKSEFMNIIVHDLRSPLSRIIGNLQLLEIEAFKSKIDKDKVLIIIDSLKQTTGNINSMLTHLIDINAFDKADAVLNKTYENLSSIIDEAKNYSKILMEKKEILFENSINNIHINVDRLKFTELFDHIFKLLVHYSKIKSKISIDSKIGISAVVVHLHLNNSHVHREEIVKFNMNNLDTKLFGENDMMLIIIKKIISLHHGTIKFYQKSADSFEIDIVLPEL